MSERILLVDDDANLLAGLRRHLAEAYEVTLAEGGSVALAETERAQKAGTPFAVVVCDMRMPGLDGIETLRRIREIAPDTVRLMLTGNADQKTAADAVNHGAIFRFLSKPCRGEDLKAALEAACVQHRLLTAERELLERTLTGSIRMLVDIAGTHDAVGAGLAARLREWVRLLTTEFRLPQRWQLEVAAALAPIGLVTVPPEIIAKRRAGLPLSGEEQALYDRHPEAAAGFIAHIPRLAKVAELVRLQDRGFDGSGYPADGPVGEAIPVDARLLKILKDLAEACAGMPLTRNAFAQLEARRRRYDPALLDKVRRVLERMMESGGQAAVEVPVAGLRPGQCLLSDIRAAGGRVVVLAGTALTEALVERVGALSRIFTIAEPIAVTV